MCGRFLHSRKRMRGFVAPIICCFKGVLKAAVSFFLLLFLFGIIWFEAAVFLDDSNRFKPVWCESQCHMHFFLCKCFLEGEVRVAGSWESCNQNTSFYLVLIFNFYRLTIFSVYLCMYVSVYVYVYLSIDQ